MSKKVKFTYFLEGKRVNKEQVDWGSNITIKVTDNKVLITKKENKWVDSLN